MSTIYLLCCSGGSYEDKWERVVCAYTDKAKAELALVMRNQYDVYLRELYKRLQKHMATFVSTIPPVAQPPYLTRKAWREGLGKHQITPDMLAERTRIEQHNKKLSDAFSDYRTAIYHEQEAEKVRYLITVEGISEKIAAETNWYPPSEDTTNYLDETDLIG